jgi:adenosine deaminase
MCDVKYGGEITQARLTRLPKAHLHVHLEGAARSTTIEEFAARAGRTQFDLWDYRGLPGLVERYRDLTSLIRTPDDLDRLIHEFVEDEARNGVLYTEPMFSPVLYADRFAWSLGDTFTFMDYAFQDAAARHQIEVGYMIGANWSRPGEAVEHLARFAADRIAQGVRAFGLSGEEPAGGLARFRRACSIARAAGLLVVPHAGETQGPANVRAAVDMLKADRIAHGVQAARDPGLLRRLADQSIVCDVCPTSNVRLGIVRSIRDHPLQAMLECGVPVTVNADDPAFLGTTVTEEYIRLQRAWCLTDADIAVLSCSGLHASGASTGTKRRILSGIDRWLRGTGYCESLELQDWEMDDNDRYNGFPNRCYGPRPDHQR